MFAHRAVAFTLQKFNHGFTQNRQSARSDSHLAAACQGKAEKLFVTPPVL